MKEIDYKNIFDDFIKSNLTVDQFIDVFMKYWRKDRDAETKFDERFQRLINRVFTSCDCYSETPESTIEITTQELKNEVDLFRHIWFG